VGGVLGATYFIREKSQTRAIEGERESRKSLLPFLSDGENNLAFSYYFNERGAVSG